jgi:TorA maturation chaperone TorD
VAVPKAAQAAPADTVAAGDDRRETEAALWSSLAAAFLAPMSEQIQAAARDWLADDLQEASDRLALPVSPHVCALREAMEHVRAPQELLLEYSRLFLPPSPVATLNLSHYVDGGPAGPCLDALEHAYESHGLQPGAHLRDLPDHAARQCECLGWLAARDAVAAAGFARLCLVGALPRLAAVLSARAPESPYTAIAHLAATAVQRYAEPSGAAVPRENRRHDRGLGVWRHCADCGEPYAREKEILIMTEALNRAGLPSTHLDRCPGCRDRAQGFFRREIG